MEGVNPGRVFVDNPERPATGVVWLHNNDGFIFFGDETNECFNKELNDFIESVIKPEAKKVGLDWFEAIGNHQGWNKTFENVFSNHSLGSWNQRVYMLHKEEFTYKNIAPIEEGYLIVKIDSDLLRNKTRVISNLSFLETEIMEFWSSSERFFDNGIGYCVIQNNKIVSMCYSGFVAGNVHCLGIETLKEHQGKRLGQNVATALIHDCLQSGIIPYWDCMETNKASSAIAEKLGFKNVFNYTGYDFSLK
ncbi:GNAT family N-acetyltransferase [Shouchella plakortidis]|uniref:GNAT family N-acetyltransferase n=1 Tax=Alkalicoccobacillus plakortidis TaxID=444060 RepID=A0ABT0XRP2_9BACI|nr:GNAT family N-acetyltransferase [Alkalicoccobacillus plakortidis]